MTVTGGPTVTGVATVAGAMGAIGAAPTGAMMTAAGGGGVPSGGRNAASGVIAIAISPSGFIAAERSLALSRLSAVANRSGPSAQ